MKIEFYTVNEKHVYACVDRPYKKVCYYITCNRMNETLFSKNELIENHKYIKILPIVVRRIIGNIQFKRVMKNIESE